MSPILLEPLVYGRRQIQIFEQHWRVQAAADRMGTLDYGIDDMLRAISPPHVPLLSLAPLMIVIRDLMTRVRFAFCMPPSSPAGSYG